MQAIRFTGPFGFLLSIPLLYAVSPIAPVATPLALLLMLLVMEQIGRRRATVRARCGVFRLLPILYIPVQLGVTAWAAWITVDPALSLASFISLAVSVGVCTGVFGMLAAHELVHSCSRWERRLGLLMLFSMSYPHFRIAHVFGHHRYAATERDPSTARLGEGFYRFLVRTIPAQLFDAWRFERRRARRRRSPCLHNSVVQDVILLAAIYVAMFVEVPRAAAFLAAQSAVAIMVLELFNYIAHYGLVRRVHDGRLEPLAPHHSWNSSGLGNLLMFNMGHHSQHHSAPGKAFEALGREAAARELPLGYAGSILLALVPPLWCAAMDHRIAQPKAATLKPSYNADSRPAPAIP